MLKFGKRKLVTIFNIDSDFFDILPAIRFYIEDEYIEDIVALGVCFQWMSLQLLCYIKLKNK